MNRLTPLPLLAALLLASAARAEEELTYVTALSYGDAEHMLAARVDFHASCGAECYAATLTCDKLSYVSFTYADVAFDVAAKAVTAGEKRFTISVGSMTQPFYIMSLRWGGEMYDTWNVEGNLQGDSAAFIAALGKAKDFKATLGGEAVTLPVTEDVKNWATACAK
jgi:hypothetical protein